MNTGAIIPVILVWLADLALMCILAEPMPSPRRRGKRLLRRLGVAALSVLAITMTCTALILGL